MIPDSVQLDEHRSNFEKWFVAQIAKLNVDRDGRVDRNGGIAIALVTFPLLEQYLRQKTGGVPTKKPFRDALREIVREIPDDEHAARFWTEYRHGLLHQLVMKSGAYALTHDVPMLHYTDDGRVFLNPVALAERTLKAILDDFPTYANGHKLLKVGQVVFAPQDPTYPISTPTLGTSSQ